MLIIGALSFMGGGCQLWLQEDCERVSFGEDGTTGGGRARAVVITYTCHNNPDKGMPKDAAGALMFFGPPVLLTGIGYIGYLRFQRKALST